MVLKRTHMHARANTHSRAPHPRTTLTLKFGGILKLMSSVDIENKSHHTGIATNSTDLTQT